jgi:D-alanyl-D-alanine carboxypeptidase
MPVPLLLIIRAAFTALLILSTLSAATSGRAALAGGLGPLTTTLAYPTPPLYATSAAVMDVDTGKWLRLQNADMRLPMASTTKIMTAILAIEHGHLMDLVKVSKAAATIGQTTMGLGAGERVNVLDLLYGLLIPSGNDAAIAIAEHVSGSQKKFVALMNAKARSLHLANTHYTNPYGFSDTADGDDPAHYSSARDLVILAQYAMKSAVFRQIVSTTSFDVPGTKYSQEHYFTTVNYFMTWYPGADGVKPGWTSGAGICQVIDVQRNGHHILAAVMHTQNTFTDMRDLMNFALGDFTWYQAHAADGSLLVGDTPASYVVSGTTRAPVWYFPYTGHAIQGAYLRYYRTHGGYAVFGAPRTEAVNVDGSQEQFFSNQVVYYNATLGAIIARRLGFDGVPSPTWLKRVHKIKNTASQRFYPETGHTVTNHFLAFYLAFGAASTFGYPITEKSYENGTLVQYFENAEFVWHDDLNGYVTAGPLGLRDLVELGFIAGDNLPPALHLPFVPPTIAATSRPTRIATATPRPTSTQTLVPTVRPTPTTRPSSTPTASQTATRPPATRTSTRTPTRSPSATRTPTQTPRVTLTPTAAASATRTPTRVSTPTPLPTRRPRPTSTPTRIGTDTPVPASGTV